MEQLQTALTSAFLSVLTSIVILGSIYIKNYINVKIQSIKTQQNAKYLDMLQDTVFQVVNSVSQTYVDTLKKEDAFTKEKQQEALNMAIDQIKAITDNKTLELLNTMQIDIDTYLKIQIENQLKLLKAG